VKTRAQSSDDAPNSPHAPVLDQGHQQRTPPMNPIRHARLAVAVIALGGLSLGTAAKADPIVGRVVGSVAGILLGKALFHATNRDAHCRLYDSNGAEVYLPCDAKRPVGELMTVGPPVAVAPQAAPQPYDLAQYDPRDQYPPQEADCGCRYGGGHAEPAYGQGAVYDAYGASGNGASYSQSAYSAAYGGAYGSAYGFDGLAGGGYTQGFYSYGAASYADGGYADGGYGQAAGRDREGFLTWPGKRPR
jgi:hypothetical protein